MSTQALRDFNEILNADGFDLKAGETWIYPTNYPIRDYQFNIVSECLFKNTLVSLPTGLGKTFIAAVVMYNYYRWYPSGKIIFMAPTKPLVKQQMEACYTIMAIPKERTAELTGAKIQTSRKDVWMSKRVFFITPHVLQNDLGLVAELGEKIKCVVIDEAHKAKGNYAYCEVINQIMAVNKQFRIIALSATPGGKLSDVSEIINNLFISHLEIRTDSSPDVMPYIFQRTMDTYVVPLGEKLQSVKTDYLKILETHTRILTHHNVIQGNCANLTKGRIFMIQKEFQERNRHVKTGAYGDIMRNLNLCITLYHGYELLIRHGLRGFLNYFSEHADNALLRGNTLLESIIADVREYLGPEPCSEILPDGTVPELPPNTKFGHPKFYKLLDILLTYFADKKNASSKVMIFTEYRDSVKEIFALLVQHAPIIKPKYFLGQSSISQKQQIAALKSFRAGECNTLISTCIGEEGLDIGEVDLIICFDISNKSPIRMIQRMGRTGRKREGKVMVLVTEGKEQEMLKQCMANRYNLCNNILKSKDLQGYLYPHNPRMVPDSLTPICQKIHISVPIAAKNKRGNIKDILHNMASSSKKGNFNDVEVIEMKDRIPEISMLWDQDDHYIDASPEPQESKKITFSKYLEPLRISQETNIVGHSTNCNVLTSLLQYADSKRYNIPITQARCYEVASTANKKGKLKKNTSSDNLRQTDIKTMFLQSQIASTNAASRNETDPFEKAFNKKSESYVNSDELHNEISTYLSISSLEESNCKICDNLFICYRTVRKGCDIKFDTWVPPDSSIINSLTPENIRAFKKDLCKEDTFDDSPTFEQSLNDIWDQFDCTFENKCEKNRTFAFEAPKSASKVLPKYEVQSSCKEKSASKMPHSTKSFDTQKADVSAFVDIDNIFGCNDSSQKICKKDDSPKSSSFYIRSKNSDTSPILNTSNRHIGASNINRKLFPSPSANKGQVKPAEVSPTINKPNLSNLSSLKKSNFFKQIDESIKQKDLKNDQNVITSSCVNKFLSNISDFCDMSLFGIAIPDTSPKKSDTSLTKRGIVCKETSNSGSEDLFESCDNSPQSNTTLCLDSARIEEVFNRDIVNTNHLSPTISNSLSPISKICSNKPDYFDADKSASIDLSIFTKELSPVLDGSRRWLTQKCIAEKRKSNNSQHSIKASDLSIFDQCDLSAFGLTEIDVASYTKRNAKENIDRIASKQETESDVSQLTITQIQSIINEPAKVMHNVSNPGKSADISIVLSSDEEEVNPSITSESLCSIQTEVTEEPIYSMCSISINKSQYDSEDEFEDLIYKGWTRTKRKIQTSLPRVLEERPISRKKKRRKREGAMPFIDEEAVLTSSDETNYRDSQPEGGSSEDYFEASFVTNDTIANTTTMHAKYLQSIKSPRRRGGFKIPQLLPIKKEDIFSQEVNSENNTYLNDTFCVDNDVQLSQVEDISELEVAEMLLERKLKAKKKREHVNKRKKRRVLVSSDSD